MPPRTLFLQPQRVRMLSIHSLRPTPAVFCLRAYPSLSPKSPGYPDRDAIPSISEKAAATTKITGKTQPEIEQGTPISEVIKRDPQALKQTPAVLRKDVTSGSKREYSTYVEPRDQDLPDVQDMAPAQADVDINAPPRLVLPEGAKYPLPTLPLPPTSILHKRYSPVLEQVTNLVMRDGKKATAQSVMTEVLSILRTKAAPVSNLRALIIPTAPSLASLPSDPIAYIQTAIDSVAPLLRIKSVKGSGGFRESVPSPLSLRQRRRKAVMWIIEAADKKKARLSLAERLADEFVAVVEGRSSAWEKRQQVHKTAVAARANVRVKVM